MCSLWLQACKKDAVMPDLKILTGFYWQSFNQLFQNNLTLVAPSKRLFCLCQVADEASFRLSLTQKKRKVTHTSSRTPSPSFYISTLKLPYCSHFHIASLPQKTLKSPPPKIPSETEMEIAPCYMLHTPLTLLTLLTLLTWFTLLTWLIKSNHFIHVCLVPMFQWERLAEGWNALWKVTVTVVSWSIF